MRGIACAIAVVFACVATPAQAQTLKVMKSLDAPHFDAHRTTWAPAADIDNMILDTLVALGFLAFGLFAMIQSRYRRM